MRTAIAVDVLLVAAGAYANPIAIDMYVDFDPPNGVFSVYPAPYTTVNAYIVAELGYLTGEDVYAVSFDVDLMFNAAVITGSFVPAFPTYTVQIVENGIVVVAEDCISVFPATLGYVPIFYTGGQDYVQINPHAYNGNTFVTCGSMEEHDYCYVMDGGLGIEPQPPRDLCGSPVRDDITWGAIKSLYR